MKRVLMVAYMITFSLMTPLGIGIGAALTETVSEGQDGSRTVPVAVLQGLAAGTLVYVVFFEILEKERAKKTHGLLQVKHIVYFEFSRAERPLLLGNISRSWICSHDLCFFIGRRSSWRSP